MILFSAPYEFLEADFVREMQSKYRVRFEQIDCEDQLFMDKHVTCWIPNPGQNFVAGQSVLSSFPNLKAISTPSTGSNHVDLPFFESRGVLVKSLLHNRTRLDSIRASSEFTLLLLLALLRKIPVALTELEQGRWRKRESDMRGREVIGKRIGIVGLGRNGGNLRKWLEAMEAEVQFYDPYTSEERGRVATLEELFESSDMVVLTVVLNEETAGMINRSLLERLRPGACLVNTSRGEIVDEEALYSVLCERQDLSYAADVLCGEVTATQFKSKLLELRESGRVLITPHIAGVCVEAQRKAALGAFENLDALGIQEILQS